MNKTIYYYNYIFKDDRGNYKIGISKNYLIRLDTIRLQNPSTKLVMKKGIIGGNESEMKEIAEERERELHKRFEKKRIYGEWFKLNKKDLVRIWKDFGYNWMPTAGKFINKKEALEIFDKSFEEAFGQ
jgi:hypothetical protein